MEIDVIITIVLMALSLIYPKSKYIAILFFLFMWTLWGWNTWNGDYIAYEEVFSFPDNSNNEFGYLVLNRLIGCFTDSYQVFLITVSFAILSFMCYFTLRLSPYPSLFAVIYFILFLMEFVFSRNYILTTLILYSLWLSCEKNSIKYFVVSILIGATIHVFSITYLLLIPSLRSELLPLKKYFVYIIPCVLILIFVSDFIFPYLGSNVVTKLSLYEKKNAITNSSYALMILVFMILFLTRYLWNSSQRPPSIVRLIYNINVISLIFIGIFYVVPYAASRFLRLLFVIDLLMFTIFLFVAKRRKKLVVSLTFTVFVAMVLAYFVESTFPYTVIPLYKCNLIWGNEFYKPVFN